LNSVNQNRTNIRTRIALGSWALADPLWPGQRRNDSIQVIHSAIRLGIRNFDTARAYGNGQAEQLVGQQLKRFRHELNRDSYSISTKIMVPAEPSQTRTLIESSLRRLCTDYVDIVYLHWPSSKRNAAPVLDKLVELRAEGKIHAIGLSNFTARMIEELVRTYPIEWCQLPLSLLWRRALSDSIPLCKRLGMKTVSYGTFGFGLLSGKYRNSQDFTEGDWRKNIFCFKDPYRSTVSELVALLQEIGKRCNLAPHEVALKWVLDQPVDQVILGARTRSQLEQTMNAITNIDEIDIDVSKVNELSIHLDNIVCSDVDNPFFHVW